MFVGVVVVVAVIVAVVVVVVVVAAAVAVVAVLVVVIFVVVAAVFDVRSRISLVLVTGHFFLLMVVDVGKMTCFVGVGGG